MFQTDPASARPRDLPPFPFYLPRSFFQERFAAIRAGQRLLAPAMYGNFYHGGRWGALWVSADELDSVQVLIMDPITAAAFVKFHLSLNEDWLPSFGYTGCVRGQWASRQIPLGLVLPLISTWASDRAHDGAGIVNFWDPRTHADVEREIATQVPSVPHVLMRYIQTTPWWDRYSRGVRFELIDEGQESALGRHPRPGYRTLDYRKPRAGIRRPTHH